MCIAVGRSSTAQEIAATRDGRQVILNPDNTWHYASVHPTTATSALDTVHAYLSARSWRDRAALVINPNKVLPLMESRYSGYSWKSPEYHLLTQTEPTPSQTGWARVEADVAGEVIPYYLKKTPDGYRIDWETSVGFNHISTEELRATRPNNLVRLRVVTQLADYYNYDFADAHNWAYSIEVRDGGRKLIGHGYAQKNDAIGSDLFGKLKDGRRHHMVLDIQYPKNAREGSVFLITGIANLNDWWIDANAQPGL